MVELNTDSTAEPHRLAKAVIESEKRLEVFRQRRKEFMRHFAGPYYGEQEHSFKEPLNLIFSVVSTVEPIIAMRGFRCGVSTPQMHIRPFAEEMRVVTDDTIRKVRAPRTLRSVARDALWAFGAVKTGHDGTSALPFVEHVSVEDYIFDRRARVREPGSYAFEGHRFRTPYEDLMDSGRLSDKAKATIEGLESKQTYADTDKAQEIGLGKGQFGADAFRREIELVELYIPHKDEIVWLPGQLSATTDEYLHAFEWRGHEAGPYDLLGFSWLSDNPIPVALVGIIYDLYLLENEIARKIGRQAQNQKDIGLVDAPTPEDAEAVRKAQDGDFVQAKDIKGTMMSFGGANEKGYQAAAFFHEFLSRIGGNIDLVGGMAAQSKTLGQDQMLMGNATVRINDMRGYVLDLAQSVTEKLAWYIWNDPSLELNLSQRLGHGVEIPVRWRPFNRQGQLSDFDFTITVSSRQSDSPEQQAERLALWAERFVLPYAGLAAQQGDRLNVALLANLAGRHLDIPEIEDLYEEGEPLEGATVQQPRQRQAVGPAMPRGQAPGSAVEKMAVEATKRQPQPAGV